MSRGRSVKRPTETYTDRPITASRSTRLYRPCARTTALEPVMRTHRRRFDHLFLQFTYNTLWSTEGGAPCPGGKHRLWINGFSLFRIFCVILYRPPICVISTGYHARLGINGSTGICDWD